MHRMHKLLNEDDWVQVTSSNCGYVGPGQLIDIAYGVTWLVKVEKEGVETVIAVKAQHLKTLGETTPKPAFSDKDKDKKKKKAKK